MAKRTDVHPVEYTDAYELNGILYVPHYTIPDLCVAPGGISYSVEFLRWSGATIKSLYLWPRLRLTGAN